MSKRMQKTKNMTISERIRKLRQVFGEVKAEKEDENVICEAKLITESNTIHKKVSNYKITKNPNVRKKAIRLTQVKCQFCFRKFCHDYILEHTNRFHPEELKNSCKICDKRFLNVNNLMMHMIKKHKSDHFSKPEKFECDFDGKLFNTRHKLFCHMKNHELKVKCHICQVELQRRYLNHHIRDVHKKEQKNQCKICKKILNNSGALFLHIKRHDNEFECQICSKTFPTEGYLASHKKEYHENYKSFGCETCGKKFNRKSHLQKHQNTHDKNRPKHFKCHRCDFSTDYSKSYKIHLKFHETQDKKFAAMKNPKKCEKCSILCRNDKALYQHMFFVHPKVPFQCDLCGKNFKTKFQVTRHVLSRTCQPKINLSVENGLKIQNVQENAVMFYQDSGSVSVKQEQLTDDEETPETSKNSENGLKIQNVQENAAIFYQEDTNLIKIEEKCSTEKPENITDPMFECDLDGKLFTSKYGLSRHMKIHVPLIECKICNLQIKPLSMSLHLKNLHADGKNFKCDLCSKTFTSKSRLQEHKTTHYKKFECKFCGIKMRKVTDLKRHENEYHINPGSYECKICDKKFNRKANLKQHLNLHNQNHEKRFKCDQCDYSTDRKSDFNKHQKYHQRQNEKSKESENTIKS